MMKRFLILIIFLQAYNLLAQQDSSRMYNWNTGIDVALLTSGTVLNTYFLIEEPNGQRFISLEEIRSVSRDEIPSFDVSATYNWNKTASNWSDVVQVASVVSPFLLLKSERVRAEKWMIALMGFETLALNQGISGFLKVSIDRKRPFVYNDDAPDELKYRRQVFYSFPSAHTSASAAATFFGATVYSHYYPESKWKPLVWATAATLPAITGYLRYEGGKHFLTDVAGGYILGAAIGILVPNLHKVSNEKVSINTFGGADMMGLSLYWMID
ncbi:MAG: phosphatase PAP2 family protein [Saprospiraceae bacterium]|nr:phosphatase PAP2 family protein [Saprospiraceae bacterium]